MFCFSVDTVTPHILNPMAYCQCQQNKYSYISTTVTSFYTLKSRNITNNIWYIIKCTYSFFAKRWKYSLFVHSHHLLFICWCNMQTHSVGLFLYWRLWRNSLCNIRPSLVTYRNWRSQVVLAQVFMVTKCFLWLVGCVIMWPVWMWAGVEQQTQEWKLWVSAVKGQFLCSLIEIKVDCLLCFDKEEAINVWKSI